MAERLVFVGCFAQGDDGAINAYRLNTETGSFTLLQQNADAENVFFLAVSSDHKYLYSIDVPGDFQTEFGNVVAWGIDGECGKLRKINQQTTHGVASCYVQIDPTGACLVVASYTAGGVGSMPILADGSLGPLTSRFEHEGASMVDADRQETSHPHCAEISNDGRFMYVCDLGLDQIRSYQLAVNSATLTPTDQVYVRALGGGGPRHFAFHPNDRNVYTNNELANSINVYRYDNNNGYLTEIQVISSLPADNNVESLTADIKITPCGSFLYCTNRIHDSITSFRIADDGQLSVIEVQPSLGAFPQNLAITDDGSTLICCNMDVAIPGSGCIAVFRIDADTGHLTQLGVPVPAASPACVMII